MNPDMSPDMNGGADNGMNGGMNGGMAQGTGGEAGGEMREDRLTGTAPAQLHMRRRLPHPPDKVWRALTEPEHLAAWFPAEVAIDGNRIRFSFGPDGVITDRDPPRLFAFTWGEDHLRWEILPDGEGSVLLLTHTFADRYGAASFASGWHICLAALKTHLAGRPQPTDQPTSQAVPDHTALHEHYVHQFGLHRPETAGGLTRVERQLTAPADLAWQAWGGPRAAPGEPPPAPFTIPPVTPGPVTRAEPAKLLEYGTAHGSVRWELTEGTGHGARLILTSADGDPQDWADHVDRLATALATHR
ncbi:SRPBCC family protein [Thermoactinospora rubra]|uniref:SRPBCC family protein n=1 Tax=Thermoactinospora rubra TaxID=1088767 RepID=UPI0019826BEF|nr:SRPBCC family protein [Thermoactinospora rubra]